MNAMRLSLFALLLVAIAGCVGCPPGEDAASSSSDWQPPTAPPRPPTGGLPDELRPPR